MQDSADEATYWDYSFEEIGTEDIDSMIDHIFHYNCNKVNLVTHGTAANSSLVLAST